jgi:hypothetical protein
MPAEKIAVPPASYPWADADARSVASYVSDELNHLDSYLISYKYEIGDRAIICENIRGFLEPMSACSNGFFTFDRSSHAQ